MIRLTIREMLKARWAMKQFRLSQMTRAQRADRRFKIATNWICAVAVLAVLLTAWIVSR